MAKITPTTMIMMSKVRTTPASAPMTAGLRFGEANVVMILAVVMVTRVELGVGVMESGIGVGVILSGTGVGVMESGTGVGVMESGIGGGVIISGTGVESETCVVVMESVTGVRVVVIVVNVMSDVFVGEMLPGGEFASDVEGGGESI